MALSANVAATLEADLSDALNTMLDEPPEDPTVAKCIIAHALLGDKSPLDAADARGHPEEWVMVRREVHTLREKALAYEAERDKAVKLIAEKEQALIDAVSEAKRQFGTSHVASDDKALRFALETHGFQPPFELPALEGLIQSIKPIEATVTRDLKSWSEEERAELERAMAAFAVAFSNAKAVAFQQVDILEQIAKGMSETAPVYGFVLNQMRSEVGYGRMQADVLQLKTKIAAEASSRPRVGLATEPSTHRPMPMAWPHKPGPVDR